MISGAKNGKVYKEKKRKNLAVLAETFFFFNKAFKQQR